MPRHRLSTHVRGPIEQPEAGAFYRLLWFVVAATVVITPLFISLTGEDTFHLPKELIVRFSGIALATIAALGLLWRRWRPAIRLADSWFLMTVAVALWTLFATAVSTNRLVSYFTALRVISLCVLFLVAYSVLIEKKLTVAVSVLLAPAVVNAVIVIFQELGIWNPFQFPDFLSQHQKSSGLLGNVNDVGTFLVVPALVAIAAAVTSARYRITNLALAVPIIVALVLNQTLTALAAFAAGAFTMTVVVLPLRKRLIAIAAGAAMLVVLIVAFPPLQSRAARIRQAYRNGQYDVIVSGRLPAYAAAIAMFEQHPLTGVGPGCYAFHFYFYRLRMEQRHPALLNSQTRMQNFGEAHNDHLQVAAEGGLPALALLLAAFIRIGSLTFKRYEQISERRHFVQILALPFAIALFVLMLAQFPLQWAASTVAIVYVSAICGAWSS